MKAKTIQCLFEQRNTPEARFVSIIADSEPPSCKITAIAGLLLEVPIDNVAKLTFATVTEFPDYIQDFARTFGRLFAAKTLPCSLSAEAVRTHHVLLGLLRAETVIDSERAHPGRIVTPFDIFGLVCASGNVLPMITDPHLTGDFSNLMGKYLTPTVACDTTERVRFASQVGACLVTVADVFESGLLPQTLLWRIVEEFQIKSRLLFISTEFGHCVRSSGEALVKLKNTLGVPVPDYTAGAQWAIHGKLK